MDGEEGDPAGLVKGGLVRSLSGLLVVVRVPIGVGWCEKYTIDFGW